MISEQSKNGLDSSNGRALKPRVLAGTALKELEQPRSFGLAKQEALNGEIGRIDHKKLQPQDKDLVVQRRRGKVSR